MLKILIICCISAILIEGKNNLSGRGETFKLIHLKFHRFMLVAWKSFAKLDWLHVENSHSVREFEILIISGIYIVDWHLSKPNIWTTCI